jgi:hypothetical protein
MKPWQKWVFGISLGINVIGILAIALSTFLAPIIFDDVVGVQLARVMDTTVTRELHFVSGELGSPHVSGENYAVSVEVPEAWVYEVRTHINGPTLLFEALISENENRVSSDIATPIFVIHALSREDYEREMAQEVWWNGVAAQTDDTYFVWTIYGPDHEFKADLPKIIESIEIIPLD